jgi:hypothetical protein
MSFSIKTIFTPGFADCNTTGNFKIACASGNELPLVLRGKSHRFKVSFNTTSINFGEVKLEGSCTKVLTINNDS